jgi:hypothetical protein
MAPTTKEPKSQATISITLPEPCKKAAMIGAVWGLFFYQSLSL